MTDRKTPRRTRSRTQTAFAYDSDVLARVRAYADREDRNVTNALNVLLDRALTAEGFPRATAGDQDA